MLNITNNSRRGLESVLRQIHLGHSWVTSTDCIWVEEGHRAFSFWGISIETDLINVWGWECDVSPQTHHGSWFATDAYISGLCMNLSRGCGNWQIMADNKHRSERKLPNVLGKYVFQFGVDCFQSQTESGSIRISWPHQSHWPWQELLHHPCVSNTDAGRRLAPFFKQSTRLPQTASVPRLRLTAWDRSLIWERCLVSVG